MLRASQRSFRVGLKKSPALEKTTNLVPEFKTIQQIRAAEGQTLDEDGNQELDYLHLGDYRLAEADPNVRISINIATRVRGNYNFSRN